MTDPNENSAAYNEATNIYRDAWGVFYEARKAYRRDEITEEAYCEAFATHAEANTAFDVAFEKEQGR